MMRTLLRKLCKDRYMGLSLVGCHVTLMCLSMEGGGAGLALRAVDVVWVGLVKQQVGMAMRPRIGGGVGGVDGDAERGPRTWPRPASSASWIT